MPRKNSKLYTYDNFDYDSDAKEFGGRLRALREERGMSLDRMATLTGIEKSSLSKIENAQRVPRYDTFLRLLDALEASPEDLMPKRFSQGDDAWRKAHAIYMRLPDGERAAAGKCLLAMMRGLRLRK